VLRRGPEMAESFQPPPGTGGSSRLPDRTAESRSSTLGFRLQAASSDTAVQANARAGQDRLPGRAFNSQAAAISSMPSRRGPPRIQIVQLAVQTLLSHLAVSDQPASVPHHRPQHVHLQLIHQHPPRALASQIAQRGTVPVQRS